MKQVTYYHFLSDDIDTKYKKLHMEDVEFLVEPQTISAIKSILVDDTCRILINLVQPVVKPNR